jgi:hypothetical protein
LDSVHNGDGLFQPRVDQGNTRTFPQPRRLLFPHVRFEQTLHRRRANVTNVENKHVANAKETFLAFFIVAGHAKIGIFLLGLLEPNEQVDLTTVIFLGVRGEERIDKGRVSE